MRIAVAGAAYDTAADAFACGNLRAVDVLDDLAAGLAASGGMGGDDASSADFVEHYDQGARETCAAIDDLAVALASVAQLTDTSSRRHRVADARAAGTVRGGVEWVGLDVGDRGVVVPDHLPPPSALGADSSATPQLWDLVVDHLQGWAWPSADVDRLHQTAGLWRDTGHRVRDLAADLDVGRSALLDQRSPEVPLALAAVDELRGHCDTVAEVCTDLAEACTDHADQVEHTRQAVRDLLQDLAVELAASAVMSGALSLVTFGGSAVAYAGYATARAVACARRVVDVLKTLTSIRAVSVAAGTYPKARSVSTALAKFRNIEHVIEAEPRAVTTPWLLTKKFADRGLSSRDNLLDHVERHLEQFPSLRGVDDYDAATRRFLAEPPRGTETIVRTDGSIVRWHPESQRFAIMSADGAPQTFYKLDRADLAADRSYFLRQVDR